MAKFAIVDKNVQMDLTEIVKYQLITHCYVKGIILTESELECLTLLAFTGDCELSLFCDMVVDKAIFKSTQTVRNCLVKLEKLNLISKKKLNDIPKESRSKKKINVSDDIVICNKGNILLNYKIVHVGTQEAIGNR